jgi:hypothetical protein
MARPQRNATRVAYGSHCRQRDQVIPRPSTTINHRLAMAAAAIHGTLRSIGPTWPGAAPLPGPIISGRLSIPAFAPKVEGSADAIT